MNRFTVIFLLIIALAGKLAAAEVGTDFANANKLYAEGKFAAAAAAYDELGRSGVRSTALFFNDANAQFKAGNLGRAIADYRQAALLSPRDTEITANLEFVRKQVQGPTTRGGHWPGAFNGLTLNEGTWLTAAFFWSTFLLFAARQWRPAWAIPLKNVSRFLVVLTVASGGVLAIQAANLFSPGTAVVVAAEATARTGPFEEAQSVFTAHDGAEFRITSRHDDWVQIDDGTGRTGWLPVKWVAISPEA